MTGDTGNLVVFMKIHNCDNIVTIILFSVQSELFASQVILENNK